MTFLSHAVQFFMFSKRSVRTSAGLRSKDVPSAKASEDVFPSNYSSLEGNM